MQMTKYKYRMIARITLEATSPLAVGSGEKDIITDAPVARDVNDLPYIPGTSLMGIIRHSLKDLKERDSIFGYQKGDKGEGSKVLISDALLLGSNQKAMDGLKNIEQDEYLKAFEVLPIRQHVRITEKGTGADHGKFDEQVVYKGTRFIFEMELLSERKDDENMQNILNTISSPTFRVGSGTRNGFGSMKVVSLKYASYDLTQEKDLDAYLKKSSSLEEDWNETIEKKPSELQGADWIKYTLTLKPLNFFLFSSGFGDEEADMTPVKENYVDWSTGKPEIKESKSLIPATSVKGAISHRTAYHWNRLTKHFVDNAEAIASDRNKACLDIFGTTLDEGDVKPSRGKAIFSDVFIENTGSKVLPHIR
jgi:CRISPR/Cas system CSM-associated protein Csm3 (group 7 of RAMP superfamily)